jgi:hypothetical protein
MRKVHLKIYNLKMTCQAKNNDDMESAEMIGDVSVSFIGDDGYVRKTAADEAENDSLESKTGFISARIILSCILRNCR